MAARDTVMNREELSRINNAMPSEAKYGEVFEAIAIAQAERTWGIASKAGKQEGIVIGVGMRVDDVSLLNQEELNQLENQSREYLDAVRQEGINEVVKWINEHLPETLANYVGFWHLWQDRLKEWGIEL